jgi:ABC-type multidrug transport system ATPase subunit
MLQVKDVSVLSNDQLVLKSVTLDVLPGTLVCIVGSSGVGKTMLLEIMAGVTQPSCGIVQDELSLQGAYGKLFIPSNPQTCESETVREYLMHSRRARPGSAYSVASDVNLMLEQMGLTSRADYYISDDRESRFVRLSFGEMKRVALARALLLEPSVLLADDLTSGLSEDDILKLMPLLRGYAHRAGRSCRSIVCTTHQGSARCMSYFDRIVMMADGGVVFDGVLCDLYTHFKTLTRVEYASLDMFDTPVNWALWHLAKGVDASARSKWDTAELVFRAREAGYFGKTSVGHPYIQLYHPTPPTSYRRQFVLCLARIWRTHTRGFKSIFFVTFSLTVLLLLCCTMINARIPQQNGTSRACGEVGVIFVVSYISTAAVRLYIPTMIELYPVVKTEIRHGMYTPIMLMLACTVCSAVQWLSLSMSAWLVAAIVLPPRSTHEYVVAVILLTLEILIHVTVLETLVFAGVRRRFVDAYVCLFQTICWMSAANVSGYIAMNLPGRMLYSITPTALTFSGLIRNRFDADVSVVSLLVDVRTEPGVFFVVQLSVYLLCLRIISWIVIHDKLRQPDRVFAFADCRKLESIYTHGLLYSRGPVEEGFSMDNITEVTSL